MTSLTWYGERDMWHGVIMGKRIRNLFYGAGTISIIPRPSTARKELDALIQRFRDAAVAHQTTWQYGDAENDN